MELHLEMAEILAGTSDHYSKAYMEASNDLSKDTEKGSKKIKKVLYDIDKLSLKLEDKRISDSKGDITSMKCYEHIMALFEMHHRFGSVKIKYMKELSVIFECLKRYKRQYIEGYKKNIKLIILEYENTVYLFTLGMIMFEKYDLKDTGVKMTRTEKKEVKQSLGMISKTIKGMARQLNHADHGKYLDELLKLANTLKTESADTSDYENLFLEDAAGVVTAIPLLFQGIGKIGKHAKRMFVGLRQTIFGVVPLIRSVMYLRYKKKVDTIKELERQSQFLRENIERLENLQTMEPGKKRMIIQRQQAQIEAFQKKAEKIRAQLIETEREASYAMNQSDQEISTPAPSAPSTQPSTPSTTTTSTSSNDDDDDLVLEFVPFNEIGYMDYPSRSRDSGRDIDVGDGQVTRQVRRPVRSQPSGPVATPSQGSALQKLLTDLNTKYETHVKYYKAMHKTPMTREEYIENPEYSGINDKSDTSFSGRVYGSNWFQRLSDAFLAGKNSL